MPKTAIFVKRYTDWGDMHDARLYKLSEPYQASDRRWYSYVVVVAAMHDQLGAETYVWPANGDGSLKMDQPLDVIPGLDHHLALKKAGYEIES